MPPLAVITGASRGIGFACAQVYLERGYQIALVSRDIDRLKTAQQKLGQNTTQIFPCDLSQPQSAATLASFIRKNHRKAPDVVVHAAGVSKSSLLVRMDPDAIDMLVNVNLKSSIWLAQSLSRMMLRDRSPAPYGHRSFVFLNSVAARIAAPGQSVYAATKGGMDAFVRALAVELAAKKITVNAVAPGYVETDMTQSDMSEDRRRHVTERIPLGRFATPQEVARLVYDVSQHSYLTGQSITMDGGLSIS